MVFPHGEIVLHRIAIDKANVSTSGLRCSPLPIVNYRRKVANGIHKICPFYPSLAFECKPLDGLELNETRAGEATGVPNVKIMRFTEFGWNDTRSHKSSSFRVYFRGGQPAWGTHYPPSHLPIPIRIAAHPIV